MHSQQGLQSFILSSSWRSEKAVESPVKLLGSFGVEEKDVAPETVRVCSPVAISKCFEELRRGSSCSSLGDKGECVRVE